MKKILEKDRVKIILELLKKDSYISYEELLKNIPTSIATIRRDINKLCESGKVKKILGGVEIIKIKEDIEFSTRSNKNIEKKKKIANKASKFLKEDDFIFLDSGTTTIELIPYMKSKNITVVTNGIANIKKLLENNIKTILIGGTVKKTTQTIIGCIAMDDIMKYSFDSCFIGANAIDENLGYFTVDLEEAMIKKIAIKNSKKRYVLADTTKIGKLSNITFADYKECILITEE